MNLPRAVFAATLLLSALMLELTLFSRLGLPGATPDLMLVSVAALALVRGPTAGAVIGFAAGMALDLAPPADGNLGTSALLLALVGYGVGLGAEAAERSAWQPLVTIALAGFLVVLGRAALGGLVGDPRVVWTEVPFLALTEAAYAAFLAVFLVPFVRAVDSRLGSEQARTRL